MSEIEKEKSIDKYPIPVTIEGTNKILYQLQNCICKIENKNGNGTGFFCYIPYKNEKIKVLITSNHVINEEIIKDNKRIRVSINDEKENKIIELENKNTYINKEYDITIIEISEKDNINNYLELDDKIYEDNIFNKSVYILQYPKSLDGQKAAVSYGIIKIIEDEYNIIHYCSTEYRSSGSPILNLLNNKIIGIYKESDKSKNYNRGTLLKYPINQYLNQYFKENINEIKLTMKVEEKYVNYKNYFLINGNCIDNNYQKEYKDSIKYYNKLLNESKIEIFINDKKYKNKKYFKPKEIGEYKIKLVFKINITNMFSMFSCCYNLTNIDLSSFNTTNVTNMGYMFYECFNLTNIDLSSFDTKNVTNMSYMFCKCSNLTNIDLSSFDTKNVTNMSWMFYGCSKLTNIDLSSFDTKNATNMSYMISDCSKLTNIDLSSFDIKNVTKMNYMISFCYNLKTVKINNIISNNKLKEQLIEKNINIID